MRVEKLMTRDVKVCRAEDTLSRAAQLMWEHDCGCVPVIGTNGDGRVVGIITDRDIAMAAYTQGWPLSAIPVSTAMEKEVISCHAEDQINRAEALMRDRKVRRLPVLDQDERLVGILSLNDIVLEAQRETGSGQRAEVNAEDLMETLAAVCRPRRDLISADS
jgi:CBS domain-containing protein